MNGKYYTKARAECNARYNDKFEEIKVRVPDGKKSKYKESAKAEEKSLNQFIIDCVENESGACKMYTAEMVKLLGEVYYHFRPPYHLFFCYFNSCYTSKLDHSLLSCRYLLLQSALFSL